MIDPGIQVCVALHENTEKVVLPIFVRHAFKLQDFAVFEIRVDDVEVPVRSEHEPS